jgi:DNA-binding response OmpR family regulator
MSSAPACIIIVVDYSDNRLLITFLLGSEGYKVVTASSYSAGLRLAQKTDFGIFIFYHWSGDNSGQELREKLGELHASTPTLFCTATPYTVAQIDNFLVAVADLLIN